MIAALSFREITTAILQAAYIISTIGLALIGLNALVLSIVYLLTRQRQPAVPAPPDDWPHVVVQLPIYNERHVVARLVDAMLALDYPRDRLTVQILDDSNDETRTIAAASVEEARALGLTIEYVRRSNRMGYKAGALEYGLTRTDAPFVAIFDADFAPEPDFLRRLMPYFIADDRLGLVQARWAHLNDGQSHLTRAQALALDSHFVVEQTARHHGGLFMNFSGTAGVWRRTCIEDSGGWQHDTLSEDIDLSYRAQLRGWGFMYLPGVGAPAEIPPLMMGFKRQQSRWATGTVQCLRKLGSVVLTSHLTPWQKAEAMLHLGGYFIHPLMILVLLLSLPLALLNGLSSLPVAGLSIAMIGPPLQALIAQRALYRDWPRRLVLFPVFMLMGIGIAVNNAQAVLRGFRDGEVEFKRTPKFHTQPDERHGWAASAYTLPFDRMIWVEGLLALYALLTAIIAWGQSPALSLFMLLYAGGFSYVALTSLGQTRIAARLQKRQRRVSLQGSAHGR